MSWKVTTKANQKKGKKKLRIWKEITRLSASAHKRGTHTNTLWINFTAAIEQVTSNVQPSKSRPSEGGKKIKNKKRRSGGGDKRKEQKHVNLLCPKEFELLRVFRGIASLALPCQAPTSSITDDKCDMTALPGKLQWQQTEHYLQQSVIGKFVKKKCICM